MKSTGIVRKVDELGRVVIPIELRRTLGIEQKDALEIYVDNEHIILKNMSLLVFSETMPGMSKLYKGKNICKSCLEDLAKSF